MQINCLFRTINGNNSRIWSWNSNVGENLQTLNFCIWILLLNRHEISTWKNELDWAKVYIILDCQQYKRNLHSNGFRFKSKFNLKNVENKKLPSPYFQYHFFVEWRFLIINGNFESSMPSVKYSFDKKSHSNLFSNKMFRNKLYFYSFYYKYTRYR